MGKSTNKNIILQTLFILNYISGITYGRRIGTNL